MGTANQTRAALARVSALETLPALVCVGLAVAIVALVGYDSRLGVAVAGLSIALTLLIVRFEWLTYAIIAVSVVLVDGWALTRSPEDVMFRIGIGRLYLMEILICLLVVGYVWRWGMSDKLHEGSFLPRTSLDWPLYAWLLAFPIFAAYGLLLGNPLQDAVGYYEWRCLLLGILFYFLLTGLFREEYDRLRLFWWFFGLASVKALYSLILLFSHIDPPLPLIFGSGPVGEGPENVMYVFAALPAVAVVVFRLEKDVWRRTWLVLGVVAFIANIVLSTKRAPQFGLAVGCAVIGLRLPFRQKLRWAACLLAAVLAVLFIGGANKGKAQESESSPFRYEEIINFLFQQGEPVSRADTLDFHLFDLVDGWNTIKQRPILGYGFGGQTQRELTLLAIASGDFVGTGIIHNQYLTFWLKMGIAGPVLFLWLVVSFLLLCHHSVRGAPQTFPAAVAVGVAAAIWGDLGMEFWGAGWVGNTKTPLVIFLALALAVGFMSQDGQGLLRERGRQHA
jgi:O-antigen ligase